MKSGFPRKVLVLYKGRDGWYINKQRLTYHELAELRCKKQQRIIELRNIEIKLDWGGYERPIKPGNIMFEWECEADAA